MTTRILGVLAAMLLLGACATSRTSYHSDRGGDYYYGRTSADVIIDSSAGYSSWGIGGRYGYGGGYGYGGYGGYYSPWAWGGRYGYSPWWGGHHGPIGGRPVQQHERRPAGHDSRHIRHDQRSNVRPLRQQSAPPQRMPKSSGYAPVPQRAAPLDRAGPRASPLSAPRSAPRAAPAMQPNPSSRAAPTFRAAPVPQRAPAAARAPTPERSGGR